MPFKAVDVAKEYEKDKKLKPEEVKSLLEWTEKQPHLPKVSELQAILFFQSCYYRMEPAKRALDNYFTYRTLCPDIFTFSLNDHYLKITMESTVMTVLPQRTSEGYTIFYSKMINKDPDYYHYPSQTKLCDMVTILGLNQKGTSEGYCMIIDMEGGSFSHLTKFHLLTAKKYTYYLQEALPVRLKAIHFINVVPFMDKIMAMMKPFLKKELMEMLHFHTSSIETLYEFVPKECMPKDYDGGEAPSILCLQERENQNIIDNFDFFEQHQKQLVDESKRPGKPKNAGDIFGVDGTFKKLEVD